MEWNLHCERQKDFMVAFIHMASMTGKVCFQSSQKSINKFISFVCFHVSSYRNRVTDVSSVEAVAQLMFCAYQAHKDIPNVVHNVYVNQLSHYYIS